MKFGACHTVSADGQTNPIGKVCMPIKQEWGIIALRVAMGIIFMVHGSQKLFGWFNGPGIEGTTMFFGNIGFPMAGFLAVVVGIVEFFGGLFLLVGFFTHIAALLLAITMLVAIFKIHLSSGFFVGAGGIEFTLILFAVALALFFLGAGPLSIDRKLGWCPCCCKGMKKMKDGNDEKENCPRCSGGACQCGS